MATYQFKTNINCSNCVSKVSPYLNQDPIRSWQVDTQSPEKTLTVESSLSSSQVQKIVEKAGFNAMPISQGFWQSKILWKRASFNTLNCLIGCTLGDFSMMIYLQINYPALSMWVVMALAMSCGLATSVALESVILRFRERFGWLQAFQTAMTMSFASMLVMELSENLTEYALTGGQFHAHNPYYWFALLIAMVMGFLVPLPYNYYKLKKFNKACH
jgi:copper chaperone CopZ